ncbi:hypothetical protein BDN72DRAFT_754242 [Pluteus cervinus]|uniref:Uncharacterized protein n=1 Tax=Pluteus cervinus TaxID=181527 RepID=A0ACD3BH80_9AGAR|nr:hypothetical protein BDN72DRAFT_754242 [Pluteus cervinus]
MDVRDEGHERRQAVWSSSLRELFFNILFSPIRLSIILLTHGLSAIRPFSPQLIPIIVCILLIPVIVLLSVYAGWSVWSSAAVNWQADLNMQYGDGVSPYAYVPISGLIPQQRYDFSIDLSVPPTETNLALGNFMTTLTLLSSSNKTITSIRRSTLLLPSKSSWFFGSNLVHLHVPMLVSFVPGTSSLTAFVELGRNDGWKSLGQGQGRELSIFSASVRGDIVHRGIRGLVSRFPLLSALVSGVFFFSVLSLTCGAFLLPMVIGRPNERTVVKREQINAPLPPVNDTDSDEESVQPAKRVKRSRGSISGSRRSGSSVKGETPSSPIPAPSTSHTSIRHRPSHALLSTESDT